MLIHKKLLKNKLFLKKILLLYFERLNEAKKHFVLLSLTIKIAMYVITECFKIYKKNITIYEFPL